MTWVALIVVGLLLILLAKYAGIPYPASNVASIIGWLLLILGVIFFVIWLMPVASTDRDGHYTPTQYTYHVNHK